MPALLCTLGTSWAVVPEAFILGNGAERYSKVVAITIGPGPVSLYLRLAHFLHGRCRSLESFSPVSDPVEIFNHNPS